MTIQETSQLVFKIAALHPQFKITPDVTIPAWAEIFSGVAFEDAMQALIQFGKISNHPFPPSSSELYGLVKEIKKQRAINQKFLDQQKRLRIEHQCEDSGMTLEQLKQFNRSLMIKAGLA